MGKIWKRGDKLTAADLNRFENGNIAEDSNTIIMNCEWYNGHPYRYISMSCSVDEIKAMCLGKNPIKLIIKDDESNINHPYVYSLSCYWDFK